ncbi:MAG TPA: iron-containing alcohol dehydrogenase, partial [Deltaproteobacteria bacterium]|nr:iron-containing alcohol dehydrogenase [Deltaproteobacteria bacterium]
MLLPGFYDFCCRVRIVSGENALEKIPAMLKKMKAHTPLVVTDKGVVGAGLVDVVRDTVGKELEIVNVFDNVPVDSDYKIVDEAAKIYRQKKCDSIIAIGGGSVIDTA